MSTTNAIELLPSSSPAMATAQFYHYQQYFGGNRFVVLLRINMDDILHTCFGEELFTTPLHHSKGKREKKIESRILWKYVDHLVPIFKTHKVSKEEIANLSCRVSYEVAPHDHSTNKNDMLYHYFASLCAQDWKFMRTWLHLFIYLHKQYFNTIASTYLKHKGLSLDNWLDGIQDGCKGNILSLLGLCLLVEKHVLVHLSNGMLWSSLKNSMDLHLHDDMLKKVDLHMVYLGRGNFTLLQ